MIEWKQRVQKLRRFDVETTQKNPQGELINISSILEVKPTSKRCHNFHVDSPFKINEISANIQRGNSTLNRWQIDEYVSIGLQRAWVDLQVDKNWTWSFRSCFSIPLVWFYHFYLFPPFVCFFRLYPNFYLSSDQSKTMKIAKFYYGERNFIFELNGKWSTKYKSINHYFLSQNNDIPR